MLTVTIDGKEMYSTYGCILAKREIGLPVVQTKQIEIPMRDGNLDLTESLSGTPKYLNREIKINFLYLGNNKAEVESNIAKDMHGKKVKIAFSDDISYYYIGRVSIDSIKTSGKADVISLICDCEPFKYDVNTSDIDWEWDTFDFDEGIINESGALVVSGQLEFTLICRRAVEFPTFTCSTAMSLVYNGQTYALKSGSQKVYRLFFKEGENNLKFIGTGTVKITYVGGSL